MSLTLTADEAEWLDAVLGLVMQIAHKWDGHTATDHGNAIKAKLMAAALTADETA